MRVIFLLTLKLLGCQLSNEEQSVENGRQRNGKSEKMVIKIIEMIKIFNTNCKGVLE